MKVISNKLNLEQLAKLLKVETLDAYDEFFDETNYCQCPEEDQDKDQCRCGFKDARENLATNYLAAIQRIADKLLEQHGLIMTVNDKTLIYRIMPKESWKEAADHIRQTINGVGYFHFDTLKEFLSSGPYTARAATLNHLGWLKSYYAVYGDCDAQAQLDRALR